VRVPGLRVELVGRGPSGTCSTGVSSVSGGSGMADREPR